VIMNAQEHVNGHVHRLYWSASPVSLEGVIEQARITLTVMIAEVRATMPDAQSSRHHPKGDGVGDRQLDRMGPLVRGFMRTASVSPRPHTFRQHRHLA
jgi:hypothetical protein